MDFNRMFRNSRQCLDREMRDREVESSILPVLKKQESNITIDELIDETPGHILIGEGGIGKTSSLLSYWKKLCDKNLENSKILPIYIKVNDLHNCKKYKCKTIIDYISRNYMEQDDIDSFKVRNVFIRECTNNANGYKVVLLIDGIDELHNKEERDSLWDEIKCFMDSDNIKALITSRFYERKVPGQFSIIRVELLEKERLEAYLCNKKIGVDNKVYMNTLFLNPMFLKLYVDSYNISMDGNDEIQQISETYVLQKFFRKQLEGHNEDNIIFIIEILLPIMCYVSFIEKIYLWDYASVKKIINQALDTIFNNNTNITHEFFINEIEYNKEKFKVYDADKWFEQVIRICCNMKILEADESYYSWQHELFYNWFTCRGFMMALKYRIVEEKTACMYIIEKIDLKNEQKYRILKLWEYFYTDYSKNKTKDDCTKEYILFLTRLVGLYDNLRKDKEAQKLSTEVLTYLEDEGIIEMFENKVELADCINKNAYALVHLRDIEVKEMIKIIFFAKEKFDFALNLIEGDASVDASKVKARIYGNIGAYFIALNKLSIEMAKKITK